VQQHSHGGDEITVAKCNFVNAVKDDIEQNPNQRVRNAYNAAVARLPMPQSDGEDEYVPEFHQLKSALNRKRREFYPPIPWRIRDVKITNQWGRTWSNKKFLCSLDNRWGFALFLTARNCSRLVECEEIFVDGTFKCCPKPYYQLVTIHGRYEERVLPMAYCLLKRKQLRLYRQVLRSIKRRVYNVTGQQFEPRKVICDFELSLILALQTELSQTSIKGCFFHFTQSVWRRIQKLGLERAYRRNSTFANFAKKLMALAHLPTAVV
jgi:hypothetical protein